MNVEHKRELAEQLSYGELIALQVILKQEIQSRWNTWAQDREALREDVAGWRDGVVDLVARLFDDMANEAEPWEEEREHYREIADLLLAESLSREQEAEEAP